MTQSAAERYLRLGLQLGRHAEGIVDAYYGPPELAVAVDAEPPVEPRTLVAAAEALLDELEDGWLRDQVVGVRTCAGALAGESGSYADEVEGYYGVRPTYTDEAVFTAAHGQLEELLPGDGPLAERHERWRNSMLVPAEQIERTIAAVIEEARTWTRDLVELPAGEGVILEIVRDKPWWADCAYLGDLRSRISVNVDLPISALELLRLTMHETYPGHHTESCSKEHLLVRGRGLLEETLVLVPTPQSLVSEGIAERAPNVLLEGDGGTALAAVIHDTGIEFDLTHALAVERALEPCTWADVNAALMLHDDGTSEAEVQAYLERWGLITPKLAAHLIRFITEPVQRTYIHTYFDRKRALPLVRGGRARALPPPADRAGARPRPTRGTRRRAHIARPVLDSTSPQRARSLAAGRAALRSSIAPCPTHSSLRSTRGPPARRASSSARSSERHGRGYRGAARSTFPRPGWSSRTRKRSADRARRGVGRAGGGRRRRARSRRDRDHQPARDDRAVGRARRAGRSRRRSSGRTAGRLRGARSCRAT